MSAFVLYIGSLMFLVMGLYYHDDAYINLSMLLSILTVAVQSKPKPTKE